MTKSQSEIFFSFKSLFTFFTTIKLLFGISGVLTRVSYFSCVLLVRLIGESHELDERLRLGVYFDLIGGVRVRRLVRDLDREYLFLYLLL